MLRAKDAGEILGISAPTVRAWCRDGKLKYELNAAGQKIFDEQYLKQYRAEKLGQTITPNKYFYLRSSNGKDILLETQKEKLIKNYGQPDKIYQDKSSGLNENRPGLKALIKQAKQDVIPFTIYITNEDRLSRFGVSYLKELFETLGGELIILDDKEEKEPQEILLQDFMSLLASFSGKFYRLRGWKQQKQFLNNINNKVDKHNV